MNKLLEFLASLTFGKTIGVALVVGAIYYLTAFNDGSELDTQIQKLNSQLQAAETKKKDTDSTLKQVSEMQEKVGRLTNQYQEISKRLPSILVSRDINKAIDDIGKNAGVKIKFKKPGDNIRKGQEIIEEVPVRLGLEGNYSELAQFVYLVSSAERMSRVKDIVIEAAAGDPNNYSGKLKFDGIVVGYKIAPEKAKKEQKQ